MRFPSRVALALLMTHALATAGFAQPVPAMTSKLVVTAAPKPAAMAVSADVIVLGRVVEIEKETVEATPFKGLPKDQAIPYKIAVIKIDQSLMGGKGLTQFRVGFPADAGPGASPPGLPGPAAPPGVGRLVRPGRIGGGTVALTADMEGCFLLAHHHGGDFYTIVSFGAPLLKKDENYAKELENVKKVVKAIEEPVAALKAKDLTDRFAAAQIILERYRIQPGGSVAREPIPAEENKLIVALLTELPWLPDTTTPVDPPDATPPSRSALWYSINTSELGFKAPKAQAQRPGDPPTDYNKLLDDATMKFLKDNAEKIQIRRFAAK